MTDRDWKRTWEVFEAAVELPAAEREAFVGKELPDSVLAERVFEMLGRLSGSGSGSSGTGGGSAALDSKSEWSRMGQTIGRFRITGRLGRGGMGEVYEAVDGELERKVAIKFLATGRFGSTGGVERFQREARAASALNHPGVVTIYEILRVDGDMAIVMELVNGEPLRKLCGQPMPRSEVARLGAQIAQALRVTHEAGIVHRDIKPENLMVRSDGFVKILDFGLARQLDQDSQHSTRGLPMGTLRYMSPEQIRGEKATAASDIFSLGLVLYELATGVHPFDADSPLATTHRIAGEPVDAPSSLLQNFDKDLESLLLRMLEKDPARRPRAGEVAAELTRESAPAAPAGRQRRLSGWVALAGVVVVSAALLLWSNRQPAPAPAPVPQASNTPLQLKTASLTSLPGDEIDPEFSPDGTRVAYAWNGGGEGREHDIYTRGVGMQDPVRLSSDPADEFGPVWSPDGWQIAYLRAAGGGVQVVVAGADGTNERVVTTGSAQSAMKKRLAWASGAEAVIFGDDSPGRRDALTLYRISVATGERQRFLPEQDGDEDLSPTLSPDGRHVAFVRVAGAHRDVYVARSDGSGLQKLVDSGQNIHSIAWAPDSEGIHYVQSEDERIIHERRLTGRDGVSYRVDGTIRHLSVSSTGRHLAYFRALNQGDIWRYTPGQGKFVKLVDLTSKEADPRYSPSGKWIAFTSDRNGVPAVFLMNAEGGAMRQVSFLNRYSGSASWSPDEQWIAFDSAPAGYTEIFVVRVSDGFQRKLGRGYMPLFSASSPGIYFTSKRSGQNEIWRVDLEGGEPVQVTTQGGLEARESVDGKWLYYTKPTTVGIFRRALGGGPEQQLPLVQPTGRYWDVGSQGVYYVAEDQLLLYDPATSQSRQLAKLDRPASGGPRGLSVGPDGSVLYLQYEIFRRELMLAEIAPVE